MDKASRSNQTKAPLSAAFVNAMRETFEEVKVLYVKEKEVLLGEKQPEGATCFVVEVEDERSGDSGGMALRERKAGAQG